jgi:Zn ribbon nucleic-acid-binding protein
MTDKRALAFQAFGTDEPFKVVAARLRTSPNTLRKQWVEEFGKEAFDARSRRIQSQAAVAFGASHKGTSHTIGLVTEPCAKCEVEVKLNLLQKVRSKKVLCPTCADFERGVDRVCPVCGIGCVGVKGLAMHLAQVEDQAHLSYQEQEEDASWAGLKEGFDYVRCFICEHRGVRIDRHIVAEHGLSVEAYRVQSPGAEVQAGVLRSARSEGAVRQHQEQPRKGLTRGVTCTSCGKPREVGLTFAPSIHEARCPDCVEFDEEKIWASLVEGQDYVTCQVCGHRAESLVSHIRSTHLELEGAYQEEFPGVRVVSLKASMKSESHREALSKAASPWTLGLTKGTDQRIADAAEKRSPVMKGIRANRFWRSVDVIKLDSDLLCTFKLKNGKISVGKAMAALGHCFVTIKRECERQGLEVSRKHIQEALCLELVAKALGGESYETEWSPEWAINPVTGWRFRYDGYFPGLSLVVEFMGHQHTVFPNFYIKEEAQFKALQERDRIKENLIHSDPTLRYFLVREDEPYADPEYLRGRLIDEGILDPGK